MLSRRVRESLAWLSDEIPAEPAYPNGFLAMNSAENWLIRPDILPIMRESIQSSLQAEHLSYSKNPGGPVELLQNTASFFNKFFAPRQPVAPEHLVSAAGGAAILDSIDFAICEEDEGMLIEAPMWEGFGLASNLRNGDRLIPVTRPAADTSLEKAIQHYLKAMETAPCRIRGIIVCNPQNPSGHIYRTPWLHALLGFCEEHDIHYISDEIYGMSTWGASRHRSVASDPDIVESPETKFTSVLSMDLKKLKVNPARVHVLYGISKDLGSSGLRLGFLVSQNNPKLLYAMWILNRYRVSSASCIIGAGLFADLLSLDSILVRNRINLRNAADYVGSFLSFHHIPFYRPVAGVFLWARLGGHAATRESDAALWKSFAAARVAVAYGKAFHEKELGWFRITFALPREDLVEGIRRVEIGLGKKQIYQHGHFQGPASSQLDLVGANRVAKSSSCIVM